MTRTIALEGQDIQVAIRKHRFSRSLRLTVREDASVLMTIPTRARLADAEHFLASRAAWVVSAVARMRALGVVPRDEAVKRYRTYRRAARLLVTSRVAHFAPLLGVQVNKISVRNQRTRWGSCSKDGNLCFNYRLALVPSVIADYVVVHELCHMRVFNHSPKFWQLVESIIPNARDLRRELRKHSLRD